MTVRGDFCLCGKALFRLWVDSYPVSLSCGCVVKSPQKFMAAITVPSCLPFVLLGLAVVTALPTAMAALYNCSDE